MSNIVSIDRIDNKNFILYCAKHYDNPQCVDTSEFIEDLERIKYIRKLITRYNDSGEIRERLILNHLIILCNVFGPKVLCRILFFKLHDQLKYIKPFLILMGILPKYVVGIGENNMTYDTDDIPMDPYIIEKLRNI
jgi:hypothetical protein